MAVRHKRMDVYDIELHLASTKAEWKQLRKQHSKLEPLGRVLGQTAFFGDGTNAHLCFYLDARMPPAKFVQYAAHEATHGAGLVFDEMTARYDGESEPFAWLVGWLCRWLYEGCA